MNPQNNSTQSGNSGQPGAAPDFADLGGPNITYENYSTPAPQPAQQAPARPTINVVNANGVISGRKMVDYLWQRIAYCALAFAGVLLIGLIVTIVIAGNMNSQTARAEAERDSYMRNAQGLYDVLGVDSQEDAVKALSKEAEFLNGGDLEKIDSLLTVAYGANYVIDFASSNLNFARANSVFKVVSVGILQASGTKRVILYGRIANGEWKLGGFDSTNMTDPCANSSDEEKQAIEGIFTCGEPIEEEAKKDDKKPDADAGETEGDAEDVE